ncbi:MAG: MmcQ/YjbR family DNA-binding protein [Ignavibacteria bacterium]|nr:MmcQ/YjbR family DNA-binding protein [Ignavibacteria bacterium]
MDLLEIINYCLSKPFAEEDFPFDDETLVFKVFGKMFALIDLFSLPLSISLKADPEEVIRLRENYEFIFPGYHLNKKYWITVKEVKYIPVSLLKRLIDNSYLEVVYKLPKYKQKLIMSKLEDAQ